LIKDYFDFDERWYRSMEQVLCLHSLEQISSLAESKDPDGEHDWEWFESLLTGNYLPVTPAIQDEELPVRFDEAFWQAYDYLMQAVEPFDVHQMGMINEMATNFDLMRMVLPRSKPIVKYVWKVWKTAAERALTREQLRTAADLVEIKNYGTKP